MARVQNVKGHYLYVRVNVLLLRAHTNDQGPIHLSLPWITPNVPIEGGSASLLKIR